jgi:hypothetical protein
MFLINKITALGGDAPPIRGELATEVWWSAKCC